MDENCTLWTLGSFCNPRLTAAEVSEKTGFMDGPSHMPANITRMVVDLGLGDGSWQQFDSAREAREFMRDNMLERFAFGFMEGDAVGHMINAYRNGDHLQFRDFQVPPHDGQPTQPPDAPGVRYAIWPIRDAD